MNKIIKKFKLAIHVLRMPTDTCFHINVLQEYLYQLYALDELYYQGILDDAKRQMFNLKVAEIKWNISEELNKLTYD